MDPQSVFCPNSDCAARGQVGKGNIGVFHKKEGRYICHQCHKTFTQTRGTVFYRLRTAHDTATLVLTLSAHGCPLQAIVAAFELEERTVQDWQARAGQHCEQVHQHVVQPPRDLGQVQADEIRVKQQGQIVWVAMAVQVATRLWSGAVVSTQRDMSLITTLVQLIRTCAWCRPLLICVDGWRAYVGAIQTVFREAIPTGARGRPALRPWDGIVIGQVVKQYAHGRVVSVVRRIVQGTETKVSDLVHRTQGVGVINTAYIEQLNATFGRGWPAWCDGDVVRCGRPHRCEPGCIWSERFTTSACIIRVCASRWQWDDRDDGIVFPGHPQWPQVLPITAGPSTNY